MKNPRVSERPVTARPVGSPYTVPTRGLHHRQGVITEAGDVVREDISDNFIADGPGCYRRIPTTKD